VPTAKETRLAELSACLNQVTANSTASFIGKVAFRARALGLGQAATTQLLKNYFTALGHEDLRPLHIAHYVKGSYRWAKDQEEAK